ncbi:MAG: RagB/SusD family nutrient uptake outer membrane protein [Bacteroidota bacterium]
MNTKNRILFISLALICLFLTSCQDMFSPESDNDYGIERTLTNPITSLGFLTTAYSLIPTTYDFSECATDDAVINDPTSAYLPMVNGAWNALSDPTGIWSSSYKAIVNVNKFLIYAPTMKISWSSSVDDSLYRKRWIAEAYGVRAYHHFMLLRYYGGVGTSGNVLGVPYLKQLVDIDQNVWGNIERPTYKSTVDSIVKDLNYAIANLPGEYIGIDRVFGIKNKNRLTSWICLAIKAELYMHAASPKYNGGSYDPAYCDSALKYSSIMIEHIGKDNGGGLASLSSVLKPKIFYTTNDNENNAEIIWRMNQASEATTAYNMSLTIEAKNYPPSLSGKGQVNPTQDFVDAFTGLNGYPITDSRSLYDPTKPYLNRDLRLDTCVIRDGGKLSPTSTIIIKTSKDDSKNGIENPGGTRTGYYLKKLLRPDFSITNPVAGKKTIRPLIRYTEMFLIFAEAGTAAHGADWKGNYSYTPRDVIKAIRKRAGITNRDAYATNLVATDFMGLVRNERRIELAFEGFRFWDLRRWGLETNVILHKARILVSGGAPQFLSIDDEIRNFTTFKYFAPIPNSEILKCPKLEQNGTN